MLNNTINKVCNIFTLSCVSYRVFILCLFVYYCFLRVRFIILCCFLSVYHLDNGFNARDMVKCIE